VRKGLGIEYQKTSNLKKPKTQLQQDPHRNVAVEMTLGIQKNFTVDNTIFHGNP